MKYFDNDKPPLCLHVLGQDLVNDMHSVGRAEIEALRRNNQAWQTELRIAKQQRDSLVAACKGLLSEIDSAIERHSMGHRVLTFDGRRKLNEAIKDCEASNG